MDNNNNLCVKKYVVEAPMPQKGQVVSSGGIRENGRIAVQFKNPVPYEETRTRINNYYIQRNIKDEMKEEIKYEAANIALNLGYDIASSVWHECLKPYCKDLFHDFIEIMVDNARNSKKSEGRLYLKAYEILEQNNNKPVLDENDNILYFPKKKIG